MKISLPTLSRSIILSYVVYYTVIEESKDYLSFAPQDLGTNTLCHWVDRQLLSDKWLFTIFTHTMNREREEL